MKLWEMREILTVSDLENYLTKSMKCKVIDQIRSQVSQNNYERYFKSYLDITHSQTEDAIALNDLQNLLEVEYHLTKSIKKLRTYLREFIIASLVCLFL